MVFCKYLNYVEPYQGLHTNNICHKAKYMKKQNTDIRKNPILNSQAAIHISVWLVVFLSPLMFFSHGEEMAFSRFLRLGMVPFVLCIVFYTNYFWLTPKYFLSGNKKKFYTISVIMIVTFAIYLHFYMSLTHDVDGKGLPHPPYMHKHPAFYLFLLRDIFDIAIADAIATMLVLSERWHQSENGRREAETARTEAELKNLRSQINPHFLLNTLNNIYALTAFNTEKAQYAIQELSKMLRHILYDNQQPYVNLTEEVKFIRNYVNLMKIRLTDNVNVEMNVDIPDNCTVRVAPLIFISLIENAFKHGISPTKPSFINITISTDGKMLVCDIKNSNFPKESADCSGHGIGLKQVEKRLELSYHENYEWTKIKIDNNTKYESKIIIYDTKLCNS